MPRNAPLGGGRTGEAPVLPGQMFRPPVQFVNMPMLHPSILAQQQQGGMNVHLLTLLQQQQQKHQPPANVLLSNGTSFPNQAVAFNQQQLSAGSINSKGELNSPGWDDKSGHTVGVDTNQGKALILHLLSLPLSMLLQLIPTNILPCCSSLVLILS